MIELDDLLGAPPAKKTAVKKKPAAPQTAAESYEAAKQKLAKAQAMLTEYEQRQTPAVSPVDVAPATTPTTAPTTPTPTKKPLVFAVLGGALLFGAGLALLWKSNRRLGGLVGGLVVGPAVGGAGYLFLKKKAAP